MMGRVLAFDYGVKRVGVAVTDPLQLIANSLDTLRTTEVFPFITAYCQKENVECFVVGYPFAHGHSPNPVIRQIDQFIEKLQRTFPDKPVHRIDESFTSKIAARTLLLSGVSKKERQNKSNVDAISANLILQTYLEMQQR